LLPVVLLSIGCVSFHFGIWREGNGIETPNKVIFKL
jgi:hypothetical protein